MTAWDPIISSLAALSAKFNKSIMFTGAVLIVPCEDITLYSYHAIGVCGLRRDWVLREVWSEYNALALLQ